MIKQKTIGKEITYEGIGLHTGNKCKIIFKPANINTGIKFFRLYEDGKDIILDADINKVITTVRGTTIGTEKIKIHTVEHLLATISGLGINNLEVHINSNEPPIGDGSAKNYVDILEQAGIVEQDTEVRFIKLPEPVFMNNNNGVVLIYLPDEKFKISYTISFKNKFNLSQHYYLEVTPDNFKNDIAYSRTFCFEHEVEMLRSIGLAKGGSLDNAIVVGDDGILNPTPLRCENEFVKHKILDLMGDLYLLGQPIKGHIIAYKSGHKNNIDFARKIKDKYDDMKKGVKKMIDINKILDILPHRYPFLLVDKIIDFEKDRYIVGMKNVTINEHFFQGHFPGHPVMPGVLIIEAMAQVGGVLLLKELEETEDKIVYFMGVNNVKWRRPVLPGDTLIFKVEVIRKRKTNCKMYGRAYVNENLVAEAELMSALVDR